MTHLTRATGNPASWRPRRVPLQFFLIAAGCAAALWLVPWLAPAADRPTARVDASPRGPRVPPQQDRQLLEAQTRDRVRARAERAEAALRGEAVDAAWAREARELIRRALASETLAATSAQELECRATLCRMRVSHRDSLARAVFESEFPIAIAPRLPQVMVAPREDDGDSPGSVLYLARDGQDL